MSIEHYLPDCTVPTVKHTKTFWIMLHVQEQFEKGPFIFQNDCAPVLKARSINTWLDEFGRPWLAHTEPWPAFLLLTSFLKMLISFSSRIWHLPHCQKHQKLVKLPWCWCAWLASKLTRPEPHRESMGYCQEEDERHQTQQCRWPEGHCQRNLGFHTTSAVPQTDHLHATPNWGSN